MSSLEVFQQQLVQSLPHLQNQQHNILKILHKKLPPETPGSELGKPWDLQVVDVKNRLLSENSY